LRKNDPNRCNNSEHYQPVSPGNKTIDGQILNLSSLDKGEAANMIIFYKQMLVSARTLQLKDYILKS
jgi:hypothetical protein